MVAGIHRARPLRLVARGQGADEFLGAQGDPWDTQSDMFLALVGAATALLTLARLHDRRIEALDAAAPALGRGEASGG